MDKSLNRSQEAEVRDHSRFEFTSRFNPMLGHDHVVQFWVGKICWRRDRLPTPVFLGFACGSAGKESACNAGAAAAAKLLQSCPTLCDPIDGSPPGSPVPGSLQARTLEWIAISFSNA